VILTWTAPDENARLFSTLAPVSAYVVKYATFSIVDEVSIGGSTMTWWSKATTAPFPPLIPSAPGTPESPMVIDLAQGTTYWFALRSVDDVGNSSPLDDNALSPAASHGSCTTAARQQQRGLCRRTQQPW
jgi:hypothetical protein